MRNCGDPAEAPEADTTGPAGACVTPWASWDGAEASPGDTSAASAADPAKRKITETATPRTHIGFLHALAFWVNKAPYYGHHSMAFGAAGRPAQFSTAFFGEAPR